MGKKNEKTTTLLQAKEAERAAAIAKAEKELNDTCAKYEAAKMQLEAANDAEEYKRLLQEVRDLEAVKAFCEKKANEARAVSLSADDYKEIVKNARESFEAIKAEQGAAILKEIEKLNNMLAEFDNDVTGINFTLLQAANLAGRSPITLNAQEIVTDNGVASVYMQSFYRLKGLNAALDNIKAGAKA